MWKGHYGREPFDLRLTMLRMLYKLPLILGLTLLGSLVLGGGYYAKNVLLRGESMYSAASRYRIEYAVEGEGRGHGIYQPDELEHLPSVGYVSGKFERKTDRYVK